MEPMRTCVGCRRRATKAELVRLTAQNGRVVVDDRQRRPGRGAYLHRSPACWQAAIRRRSMPRALRAPQADPTGILDQLVPLGDTGDSADGAPSGPRSDHDVDHDVDHDRGPLR